MNLSHGYARFAVIFLLLAALVVAVIGAPPADLPPKPTPAAGHLLITEVYYDPYMPDKAEEFVRIFNPTTEEVDLTGWSIGDGKRAIFFGEGVRIVPGGSLYVAREAWAFRREMAMQPDFEFARDSDPYVPQMIVAGELPVWPRTGGAVILQDAAGVEIDVVLYGTGGGYRGLGWIGPPVPLGVRGEVLDRARDEAAISAESAGKYLPDTDTAADWWQGSTWKDLRIYQRGQTFLPYPTFLARSVTAYSSPDSSFATLVALFRGAQRRIDICVYEFHLVQLAEEVAAAAARGVQVRLLLEGAPVGGVVDQGRYVSRMIHEAGGQVRYLIHDSPNQIWSRYAFVHAKYGVIDGERLFVQSENFKVTGTPVDPTAGNRGWGVVVADEGLAAYMTEVFEADWNPAFRDSYPYTEGTRFGAPAPGFVPDRDVPSGEYPHIYPPLTVPGPIIVTPVLAPDHALLETKGIIGLIRGARESLLVEQQYAQVCCAMLTTRQNPYGTRLLAGAFPI